METATASANRFCQAEIEEISPAEHVRTIHWHTPKPSVALADVLVPEYWARLTRQLRSLDRIECCARDGSWFAELLVRSVGGDHAVVRMLRGGPLGSDFAPPGAFTAEPGADLDITYEGPFLRWCVKASDGRTMKSNLESQQQAVNWIAQYRRAVHT